MRRIAAVAVLVIAIGVGAWWGYGFRERVKMENEHQHAEAAFELLEQMRGAAGGHSFENSQRFLSISSSAEMELLNLDLQSPVARAVNSYHIAIMDRSTAKKELEIANLKVEQAELEGKGTASMHSLKNRVIVAKTKFEAIAPIVDTCHDDVTHFLYGIASTNTCEASVNRFEAMYPDK